MSRLYFAALLGILALLPCGQAQANPGIDSVPGVDLPISAGGTKAMTIGAGATVPAGDVTFLNSIHVTGTFGGITVSCPDPADILLSINASGMPSCLSISSISATLTAAEATETSATSQENTAATATSVAVSVAAVEAAAETAANAAANAAAAAAQAQAAATAAANATP